MRVLDLDQYSLRFYNILHNIARYGYELLVTPYLLNTDGLETHGRVRMVNVARI